VIAFALCRLASDLSSQCIFAAVLLIHFTAAARLISRVLLPIRSPTWPRAAFAERLAWRGFAHGMLGGTVHDLLMHLCSL
jgi:hypothetical protein